MYVKRDAPETDIVDGWPFYALSTRTTVDTREHMPKHHEAKLPCVGTCGIDLGLLVLVISKRRWECVLLQIRMLSPLDRDFETCTVDASFEPE